MRINIVVDVASLTEQRQEHGAFIDVPHDGSRDSNLPHGTAVSVSTRCHSVSRGANLGPLV